MGPVGRALGVGQAAARQRPASVAWLPRHLVSRAAGRAGLRHPRRHLAGLARRRARPQRHDRLGLHHHQPRQPGPVRRAGRSDRSQPLPHARRRRARSACARRRSTCCWGEPVRLRVRSTRHGVVIDDFARKPDEYSPAGHVLALQATALDGGDTSLEGLLRISQAQNWNDFLAATRRVITPMQNVVYADTAGNIGLMSPARVPIRRKGDGSPALARLDRRIRLGGLRAIRRPAAGLQSGERHHRQRQCPAGAGRLSLFHHPRLGGALPPAPRQPAAARGRAPSGLRHDRHPGRQSHARRSRDGAAAAEARAAQSARRQGARA